MIGTTHYLKRLTPGIFCTGRLTTRQLGYVSEAGFASILSITEFDSSEEIFNDMAGKWPSTGQEGDILSEYGTKFKAMNAQLSTESYNDFVQMMLTMPRPTIVQSGDGWLAALFVELYLSQVGATDIADIYNNSLTLGYDYQSDQDAVNLINAVTGLETAVVSPAIDLSLSQGEDSYMSYFWPHRLGSDNWYTLGQILDTHITAIEAAGYKTVISFRADGEGTNRLSWEPATGPVENGEFSDAEGKYNVTAESAAVTRASMKFYNLPVTGENAYTKEQFDSFLPIFNEANENGPVLVHCASGYRSSVYTLAFMAMEAPEERCVDWALKEARRVGESFDILPSDEEKAVGFWRETLAC